MNIQILDSWLREHLSTNAKPQELADALSLCGPSFEKVDKLKIDGRSDYLYDIEVTTNRVDMMSVIGIAREACVILPEFGFKAKLKNYNYKTPKSIRKNNINLKVDTKLTSRVMGVVLEVTKIGQSPKWMKSRLEASGVRSLNLAVDITNYVMLEVGHPTHVFDYDLVAPNMVLRESKSGESIVSLDNKSYKLVSGDIVIDNGSGKIIDLPGIIGTRNSVVNRETKRILFFMETNDPARIRKTSIRLGIRTNAAVLNEKGVDPYLAEIAMNRGLELFTSLSDAKATSEIYDVFPVKPKIQTIAVSHDFIEKILGVSINSSQIVRILTTLEFGVKKTSKNYIVTPPTFRAKDIQIPEDVVEEIARIYGYFKLPSQIMAGIIPPQPNDSPFEFEREIKRNLICLGANEVYTNSLVSDSMTSINTIKIANPLGADTSKLRKSLKESLVNAADSNKNFDKFHLFEMANVYIPDRDLPKEVMTIAGILKGYKYREAKGVIEAFLKNLRVKSQLNQSDGDSYMSMRRVEVVGLGEFGVLTSGYFYYSFAVSNLAKSQMPLTYIPIPKYPAQIEDITLAIRSQIHIVDVIEDIKRVDKRIVAVELTDKYKNNYTFRIHYQDPNKTLDDSEVETIRKKIVDKTALLA